MFVFGVLIGIIIGLSIGVALGAEIINDRNRELKYLRKELSKQAKRYVKEWWEI